MTRLLLVRHGESGWNAAGLVQGQSAAAPGLTARGRAQMAAVADEVCGRVAGAGPVRLLASDLRRAVESAEVLAARLAVPVALDPRWRERSFGVLEGGPAPPATEWTGVAGERVVDPDRSPPGGESVRQLAERVAGALADLADAAARGDEPPGTVVVVTHGGVVRVAVAVRAGVPVGDMVWGPVGNAAAVLLTLPRPAPAPGMPPVSPGSR